MKLNKFLIVILIMIFAFSALIVKNSAQIANMNVKTADFCFGESVKNLATSTKKGTQKTSVVRAENSELITNNYYSVYDVDDKSKIIFVRGDRVFDGDFYISGDNFLYEIVEVNDAQKMAYAKLIGAETMPEYNIKPRDNQVVSVGARAKKIGMYHTHNDECYTPTDGTDSVYGKGGVYDVGAKLKEKFNSLGIDVDYSENLHLPHNSGAYTRSQVTASNLIQKGGLDGIFDIHRDSTPAKEYKTTVNGKAMSKVRMVVGSGNQNYAENKEFAKSIKAYADKAYPGLIKDIYMGKGNYNQQLTPRAMLFEMGCDNLDKSLVLASCEPLAKTVDVVLYGSKRASEKSLNDIELASDNGGSLVLTGLADNGSNASASFVWVLLASIGFYFAILGIVCIFSKTARYKTKRFFSELFAGVFGKSRSKA